ncbi:NADPH:quinone reductase-like Zn-dependent oxidoreductase [Actinocorallia herbida]|uniref:NADPH:quinone reductase-like Zn-dependent oxidoreductase n=1 Tax=Actinocorallia herbida TaxID=58109 RepID=A0A3N1D9K3_9ACTN|nr:NADP-dependent oxidoreductase [Actinocorallia herbida]ROO90215.1 NADPH:quinone reductase-like Zn-dependent oxidoreductase [Actinocorallia herbida]
MRKLVQDAFGTPAEVLRITEAARPEPGPGQVLIEVAAAGVNPVDVAVSAGHYPLLGDPPFTAGWDVAGTVAAVGSGVSAFRPGDRVLGLPAFPAEAAAHAEYVLASANELIPIPKGLAVEEAGALPLVGLTAYQALIGIAEVRPGQRVLVHRAAGGVGHLAVQLAKSRGAWVVGTASAGKHDLVRALGADEVIDYQATDYTEVLAGLDVVFDLVGHDNGPRSAGVLRAGGVLVGALPAFLGLTQEEAAARGIRLAGVDVRPSAHDLGHLTALASDGALRVHVEAAFPLADAAKAYETVAAGHVTGKVVLVP